MERKSIITHIWANEDEEHGLISLTIANNSGYLTCTGQIDLEEMTELRDNIGRIICKIEERKFNNKTKKESELNG